MNNEQMLLQLDGKMDEMIKWQATMSERCCSHRSLTTEVRQTIYGNPGKSDGLQFDVSRLTNGRKFWSYVVRGIVLFAIVAGSSGVFSLISHYLKG